MAVRNFYASIENDRGRGHCATGPAGKDEGFWITVKQRNRGAIVPALTIRGTVNDSGQLTLIVRDANNVELHTVTTER